MRPNDEGLLVRYWAGARAAAGIPQEYVAHPADATIADVVAIVAAARPQLGPVFEVASLLLDGRAAPPQEPVGAAEVLEVLPPFAGG